MATATQPVLELTTVWTKCPRAAAKGRITGFLGGNFAVLTCEEPDGIRHVRVFATQLERDKVAFLYHRSGCPIGQCLGGKHVTLNFSHAES